MLTNTVEVVMVLLAHPAILAWVLVAEPWPVTNCSSELLCTLALKLSFIVNLYASTIVQAWVRFTRVQIFTFLSFEFHWTYTFNLPFAIM